MLKKTRITFKILLCISVIVAWCLAHSYLVNLRPDVDGFLISSNLVTMLIYGEEQNFEILYNGFKASTGCSVFFAIVNTILDIIVIAKKPKVAVGISTQTAETTEDEKEPKEDSV